MTKQMWEQMGVELEGGWDIDRNTVAGKCVDAKSKTDGSVNVHAPSIGEITTRPHRKLANLLGDVRILHPTVVNDTCGLHVHTSFSPIHTSLLTTKDFWDYFQDFWYKWGMERKDVFTKDERDRYWSRFEGKKRAHAERSYCQKKFIPAEQLNYHDDRYTQVNFVAYKKYKTVEIRLFPMFQNPDITVSAIEGVAEMYNSFLAQGIFPEIRVDQELEQKGDCVIETENLRLPAFEPWEEKREDKYRPVATGENVFYSIEGANEIMLPWSQNVKNNSL